MFQSLDNFEPFLKKIPRNFYWTALDSTRLDILLFIPTNQSISQRDSAFLCCCSPTSLYEHFHETGQRRYIQNLAERNWPFLSIERKRNGHEFARLPIISVNFQLRIPPPPPREHNNRPWNFLIITGAPCRFHDELCTWQRVSLKRPRFDPFEARKL